MPGSFLDALNDRVLVCDGAMGTALYGRGVFLNRSFDELNLTQSKLVVDVHQSYVQAGADVIETNTFGANRLKLGAFGLADEMHAINVQGARLARRAASDATWVAGSIGPLGVRIEPWGKIGVTEAEAIFRDQAAALVEGGVDLFVLETFRDVNEMTAAIRAVRSVSSLPIVAQMTTEDDGNGLDGTPPESFAPELERAGASVIGLNCSVGPAAMLESLERLSSVTSAPLSAQPNAGRPRDVDGRNLYLCSPEYMAMYARRFIAAGARLIGGCCGTTPEHIRHIKTAVLAAAPAAGRKPHVPAHVSGQTEPLSGVPAREKSALGRALAEGTFVVLAETSAPRGIDLHEVVEQAERFRGLGVTAVNVPDYPKSGARVSALALSLLIPQDSHVEAVLHYACRDRALGAIQSELLGAHALGLRNVLVVTGDRAGQATYPDATSVSDVDSIGVVNMVVRLNQGLDIGGQPLGAQTRFLIGVAVNPFAPHPESEWRRLDYKVEAGAEFIVTSPILDLAAFEIVWPRLQASGLPIIAGVIALESVRQAEFLASEANVQVPDSVLDRLRTAKDPKIEGVAMTREIIDALRSKVQGVQVSALHGSAAAIERALPVAGTISPRASS